MRRGVRSILVLPALLAAAALAAGCGSSTHPGGGRRGPAVHAAVGFSDEDPAAFSDPHFRLLERRLQIRDARLIVPFDSPARMPGWLAATRAAGLSPYVTLGGDDSCNNPRGTVPSTGNCPPPSDAAYIAGLTAFLRAYPSVHEWGAWNEPSNFVYYPCATPAGGLVPAAHACALARLRPGQAAAYWRDAVAADRLLGRSDTIVAGETGSDCVAPAFNLCTKDGGRTWSGYVPAYLAALGAARPAVWGTHSYHDIQQRPALAASETNRFVQYVDGVAGVPTIWLTEEGTWLGGIDGAALDGNAAAQRSAAEEFLALPLVPAARPGQIAREYYYQLRAKPGIGFDAALLDVNGAPRPAFCVLAGDPADRCAGNPTQQRPAGAAGAA